MIKKHKILVFLLSLLAAVVFWIYVVTTIAPDTTGSVSGIRVSVYGDTVLEARGLIVTDYGTQSVRVDLEGSRATLSKLNAGNVMASLDVSRISEPGEYDLSYTISFPDTVNTGDISIKNKSVDTIHITVSELATKSLRLELNWEGQIAEGYVFDAEQVSFSPEKVELKGPSDEIEQIAAAVVNYDVSALEQSTTEKLPIVFLDAEGNQLRLSSKVSASITETSVKLPILRWKDITLALDLDYGVGTGISEDNVEVTLNPTTIRVSGETDVIESLPDTITLDTIDLTRVENGEEIELTISLPAGVDNVSGITSATATVRFNGLSTATYSVSDIELINVPEGYSADISSKTLSVQLRGSRDVLQSISEENIHITIDLSGYTQSGSYTVPFTVVIDGDPAVGTIGKLDALVTLS